MPGFVTQSRQHLAEIGESYSEHLSFAARSGGTMIAAGIACIVHGVAPFLFTTTGSDSVATLVERFAARRAATARRRMGA